MMYRPLTAVIIAVYNSARTLNKCIESVFQQTYSNWEIIIVDSDSKDETREIALKWVRKYPGKCRYYNISKRDQASKFNFGALMSKGERIYLHGSDQYLTPTVLEECVAKASTSDAIGVPVEFLVPRSYLARSIFYSIFLPSPEPIDYPNFIKRGDWVRLGGMDERITYVEDFDFYERFKAAHLTMGHINAVSFHDQSYTFTSMMLKTIYTLKGEQALKKKLKIAGAKLQRDTVKVNVLKSAWIMLKSFPIYLPGIAFAISVRLIIRAFVKGLYCQCDT